MLALAPSGRGPCHAQGNGFDLHIAGVVPPRDRARLERLCRYTLRPPIAADRLPLTADGQVVLDLRHPMADGTMQLLFEPVELLERLAALTPRPRINLLLYYGVLGARSAWRSRLQAREPDTAVARDRGTTAVDSSSRATPIPSRRTWLWAELMQRSFGFDVFACPRAGPSRVDRAHRRPDGDSAHPASSRSAHGSAHTPSRAASSAPARAIGAVVWPRRCAGVLTANVP